MFSAPLTPLRPLSRREWFSLLATLIFSLVTLSPTALGSSEDESLYVQTALEMVKSGDAWQATNEGVPHWHKPVLLYWLTAAAVKTLGPTALAARLFAALFSWGTALCLFLLARRVFTVTAALPVLWVR